MKSGREDRAHVEAFEHAVDVVFLAQEILVGYSSYPTPRSAERRSGSGSLGSYLGALLMGAGAPVRLDEGPSTRRRSPGLMTGRAYSQVGGDRCADGPFDGYPGQPGADVG